MLAARDWSDFDITIARTDAVGYLEFLVVKGAHAFTWTTRTDQATQFTDFQEGLRWFTRAYSELVEDSALQFQNLQLRIQPRLMKEEEIDVRRTDCPPSAEADDTGPPLSEEGPDGAGPQARCTIAEAARDASSLGEQEE
jgi:hypothetical protein